MLGDLRQMCKQFISLSLSLSLSHICLCVNWIMMYILTNISHPDPVASLCLPHLPPLVCCSGACACIHVSMLAHELQCVQRNGQVKSHYIVEWKLTVTLTYDYMQAACMKWHATVTQWWYGQISNICIDFVRCHSRALEWWRFILSGLSFFLIHGQQRKVNLSCIGGQTGKDCHPTGSPVRVVAVEPATASRSESAAQTTALQESTPNVTVRNAVSLLLHDKGKPLGLPFLSREKNRAPPPSCKRRSFVNQCSILLDLHPRNGPGLAPFRTLTQFMQVIYWFFSHCVSLPGRSIVRNNTQLLCALSDDRPTVSLIVTAPLSVYHWGLSTVSLIVTALLSVYHWALSTVSWIVTALLSLYHWGLFVLRTFIFLSNVHCRNRRITTTNHIKGRSSNSNECSRSSIWCCACTFDNIPEKKRTERND